MMRQPSRGVHMPTDGLTGWGESARRVGEGLSAMLSGASEVLQQRAQVAAAGELADFAEKLKTIDRETRDELADQEIQDWGYAWRTANAPKVAEAINSLSAETRRAGQQLAMAYNARAEVEAQRDYEINKINTARSRWRQQLQNAVDEGDAQQAREWIEAGQGIFLAPEHVQQERQAAESQASLSHWQKKLQAAPLPALSELADAPQNELPQNDSDAQRLDYARKLAGQTVRRQVLANLAACLDSEVAPDREYMNLAVKAGALTQEQAKNVLETHQPELTRAGRRQWMRRVDESDEGDDAAEQLMLRIATADISTRDKKKLMLRAEQNRSLAAHDRRSLSSALWGLYENGAFGCPEDETAQAHFEQLQSRSMSLLQQEGAEAARKWVRRLGDAAECWLCFSDDNSNDSLI